jgi:hypothetical protein
MLANTHSAIIVVFNLVTGREPVPAVNVVGVVVAIVGAGVSIWDSSRHVKTSPRPPGTIPTGTPTVIGDVVAASSACFGAAFLVLAKKFRAKVELSHYMWLSMVVNLPMSLAAFLGYAVGVNAVPTWVTLIGMACITCGAGVISAHAGAT